MVKRILGSILSLLRYMGVKVCGGGVATDDLRAFIAVHSEDWMDVETGENRSVGRMKDVGESRDGSDLCSGHIVR